jgi:hypothetical protein
MYKDEGLKRYEVNEVKTARFLSEKLFTGSTKKTIPMNFVKDMKTFMHRKDIQAFRTLH